MSNVCPKCGRSTLRCKVEAFLDIPTKMVHRLSKLMMRSREVQVEGVNWPKMLTYCTSCGHTERRG